MISEREEEALRSALRALASATHEAQAPGSVENVLLRAYRRERLRSRGSVWARSLAWKIAAAIALVAAAVSLSRIRPEMPPRVSRERPESVSPAEFLPLPVAQSAMPLESGQVLRMRLPRSALTAFGLPVDGQYAAPVQADVLFGEDGVARAIRFVSSDTRRRQQQ